jgi:ATP-dependent protease ClpP protease subunit
VASWNEVLDEIERNKPAYDLVRRKYLQQLSELTGRNVIAYYSGWLQRDNNSSQFINQIMSIHDADKNGFMAMVNKLDKSKGLDLILHTPGGDVSATESLIDYLRDVFGENIRAIVPQLAMSGGTMIACACKSIVMGRQSSLGPVDPQISGISVSGIIEEFERVKKEIMQDQRNILVWQNIIGKYPPSFVGDCEKADNWSKEILRENLGSCMLKEDPDKEAKIENICLELGDHARSKSHSRHLPKEYCKEIGLVIEDLEKDQAFQDAVLTVHHAFMHTLGSTTAIKIIENHNGAAYIQHMPMVIQQR